MTKEFGDNTVLMADTCLDEFTDHGHCGVLTGDGRVDNDATLDFSRPGKPTENPFIEASMGASEPNA